MHRPLMTVVVLLLVTTRLSAQEPSRVLNGHEFIPSRIVDHPFAVSYLGSLTGGGLAFNLKTPFVDLAGDTLGTLEGDVAFVALGVHALDLYATFANVAGGSVPGDRVMDSVDQTEFFLGEQEKSNRDAFVVYVGNDLFGVKWRNWKMMFKEVERGTDAKRTYDFPRFYNLYNDPKEEYPLTNETPGHLWVRWPAHGCCAHGAPDIPRSRAANPAGYAGPVRACERIALTRYRADFSARSSVQS